MSYEHLRRSSRIPKELAILLTGSDMDGRGFSEMTKTVLLSRHGAGIISTYKLSAEQEIIIRYLDTNKEAVVRVAGRIGSEGEIYTYGVAFVDPSMIDFWGIDFAPTSEAEKVARSVLLECGNCKQRETVQQSEVESDVFLINEGIVRYCKECGDSTLWKRAVVLPRETEEEQPVLVVAARDSSEPSFFEATSTARPGVSWAPEEEPVVPAPAPPVATPSVSQDNRRKHPRTKVSYKACVRRSGFLDDVVTCEDMSKGGICFKSRKQYFARADIEIAVPYSPGGNAIFVPAEIAWVVEVTKDKLYRCGVAYRRPSRPS
ncbi:MAG: PilZ domain-containing protein [Candidatus Acidiferrum sp.]